MRKIRIKKVKIQTKNGKYACQFESNYPEKGYTVTVPSLKGIVTFGNNLVEAKKMVKEAIELHCEVETESSSKVSRSREHLLKQWV